MMNIYQKLKAVFRHFVGGLYNRFGDHHVFLLSGGLAFSLFVCIVPFTLIIFAVLTNILEMPSIDSQFRGLIEKLIPYGKYADFAEKMILGRVAEFKIYRDTAGLIGLAGLLFAASGLFSSMRTILNRVYNTTSTPSAIIGKLKDLGLVILVLTFFMFSAIVLSSFDIYNEITTRIESLSMYRLDLLGTLLYRGISLFIMFAAFGMIYFLVPQQKIPKKVIAISALTAALLWETARLLFGFYITNIASLDNIYGAYSLIVVTAFWIYYTSLVFIVGAEFGQLYREWLDRKKIMILA